MKLGDMKCPWDPDKTMRECVILHEGPPLTVVDITTMVVCPACGERGTYWEDRISVHDSIVGFEIREAGIEHPDGRLCSEW